MSINSIMKEIVTIANVKTIVERVWNHDAEVVDYKVEPYSSEMLGFLSCICCLIITVRKKNTNEIESRNFFMKCIPPHNDMLANYMTELGVFDRESNFYSCVVPLLQQGYQGEPWAPSCYLVTKNVLVCEHLKNKGFTIRNKLLNKEEITAAIFTIARMHAASILAEKSVGKTLNQVCPRTFDLSFYYEPEGLWKKWFQTGINLTIDIAEQFGLESDRIEITCNKLLELVKPAKEKQNVVTHSDLWSNNIMFDESSQPKCMFVDYQMVRYCPPAQDMIIFLYLCTNRHFREKYEDEMVKRYYNTLCDTLRTHQPQIQVPEWSEFIQQVEEQRLAAVIYATALCPISLLDGKLCAELFKDYSNFNKFMYQNRREYIRSFMKKDKEYAERIREIVIELVEISKKLN